MVFNPPSSTGDQHTIPYRLRTGVKNTKKLKGDSYYPTYIENSKLTHRNVYYIYQRRFFYFSRIPAHVKSISSTVSMMNVGMVPWYNTITHGQMLRLIMLYQQQQQCPRRIHLFLAAAAVPQKKKTEDTRTIARQAVEAEFRRRRRHNSKRGYNSSEDDEQKARPPHK